MQLFTAVSTFKVYTETTRRSNVQASRALYNELHKNLRTAGDGRRRLTATSAVACYRFFLCERLSASMVRSLHCIEPCPTCALDQAIGNTAIPQCRLAIAVGSCNLASKQNTKAKLLRLEIQQRNNLQSIIRTILLV